MSHIHIIDRDARRRAEAARAVVDISHHAEIYESHAEFCQRPRETGLLLIEEGEAANMLEQLATSELGLPVIVFAEAPQTELDCGRNAVWCGRFHRMADHQG